MWPTGQLYPLKVFYSTFTKVPTVRKEQRLSSTLTVALCYGVVRVRSTYVHISLYIHVLVSSTLAKLISCLSSVFEELACFVVSTTGIFIVERIVQEKSKKIFYNFRARDSEIF